MQVFCGHKKAHLLVSLGLFPHYVSHPFPHPWPQLHTPGKKTVMFLHLAACSVRRGQWKWVWCVNDRSPGNASGGCLIWLVWSWKLTRSHWKWLLLGMAFILVYLFFFKPFLKFCGSFFFVQMDTFSWVCVYVCKSICIFLSLFFVTAGQGRKLLMQIAHLNKFIICHGREMFVQAVEKRFL